MQTFIFYDIIDTTNILLHKKDGADMIKIITISREFGSGGHTIGKMVAKKLGWKFYDKEIVDAAAVESGMPKEFVENSGEYAGSTNSFMFNLSMGASLGSGTLPMYDKVYVAQCKIINEYANEGNCVIVGRCADYILGDREDCLNVFIHADIEARKKRVERLYGDESDKPLEKRIIDKDKRRKVYYKNYTGRNVGDLKNYHMTLDSEKIGIEKCVDLIVDSVK